MLRDGSRRPVFRETVVPAEMTDEEKKRCARDLYTVHSKIFSGVSFERFTSHVIEPPAEHTEIQVYRGASGELVGYCAFHRFSREIGGRPLKVLRAEAGLLPEYRGRAIAHWFGMQGALREKLRHPFRRVIYFGTLVHPSSYRFFCKYFPRVFPHHNRKMSSTSHGVAVSLAESFDNPAVDPDNPLVRDVGWVTKKTLEHPALVSAQGLDDVEHFRNLNPGYARGHGLVVLVPVTIRNVGQAILTRIWETFVGWLRRRPAPL